MDFDLSKLESMMYEWMDQIKAILSEETWENILMNCSKNELFVLMLLYRGSDVNMTQISDYLSAPLNTTTGIVSRMEKKDMVRRLRSEADKRVVTIVLTERGKQQINDIIGVFLNYAQKVLATLKPEEMALLTEVIGKVVKVLKESPLTRQSEKPKIRKIEIEI